MTADRWDTREHRDGDRRRIRPGGGAYEPWHDATTAIDGDAARTIGDLACERWQRATGERLETSPEPPNFGLMTLWGAYRPSELRIDLGYRAAAELGRYRYPAGPRARFVAPVPTVAGRDEHLY